MALYRIEGLGVRVQLTPEEEAAVLQAQPSDADALVARQNTFIDQIDGWANAVRQRNDTGNTPTESGIYDIKRAEATAWKNAGDTGDPDPVTYPMLASEVGRSGKPASDVADLWFTKFNEQRAGLLVVYARVDTARLNAKEAVRAATTNEEMDTALDAFCLALDIPKVQEADLLAAAAKAGTKP